MFDEQRDTTAADHINNEETPRLITFFLDKGYK